MSLNRGQNDEEEETFSKLRQSLIEAYISIVHASGNTQDPEFENFTQ